MQCLMTAHPARSFHSLFLSNKNNQQRTTGRRTQKTRWPNLSWARSWVSPYSGTLQRLLPQPAGSTDSSSKIKPNKVSRVEDNNRKNHQRTRSSQAAHLDSRLRSQSSSPAQRDRRRADYRDPRRGDDRDHRLRDNGDPRLQDDRDPPRGNDGNLRPQVNRDPRQ
ncbi:hypothetical protein PGT21_033765 [Puccinia graminis f. sp. tritici]|uniref:Uncharacterized protein n=1 Tax=Puccinia graminis f. sp. tritici TaxID=56615 RepID=A0A5B0MMM3_PUCGR|nr:hypothetical protein PGT21_033765 [Puccinia graminis f. sp. tritici]